MFVISEKEQDDNEIERRMDEWQEVGKKKMCIEWNKNSSNREKKKLFIVLETNVQR